MSTRLRPPPAAETAVELPAPAYSLRQLQYAVAVADTGGFRRAAERCHVSQPSLSAQLAQLESALGVRLFERDRRRVLLTAAGEEIVARAREALVAAGDVLLAARRLGDPLASTLRVGVIATVAPYLLPEIAPALKARYPRLTLHWTEDKTARLLRDLAQGQLDAVLLAQVPGMEPFEQDVILEDRFVLAGAPGEPLLRGRRPADLAELEGRSVLLLEEGHCFRDQALALCARAGVAETDFRATSLSTLARMAAAGAEGRLAAPARARRARGVSGEIGFRGIGGHWSLTPVNPLFTLSPIP